MDFRFDDDEKMLHDLCLRFAREQLVEAGAEADRAGECPAELLEKGLELGLFLDAIPAEQGGYLEGDYSHTQRLVRVMALAHGCPAVTLRYEANTEYALAAPRLGEPALETLAALTNPTTALASLVLEDPGAPLRLENGRLSGRVGAVPNAVGARFMLVVSAEEAENPFVAAFEVESGLQVEAAKPMGLCATAVGHVSLTDAPALAVLEGEEARGLVSELRNTHRLVAGGLGVGAAEQALEDAEAYAEERIQFGRAIIDFESMQRLLEENRARLAAARYLVFAGAQALDHGEPARALCRYASEVAGEAAVQAAIDAVQIYGGYGYVNDYPVEKSMRDLRACTMLAGDGLREQVLAGARA